MVLECKFCGWILENQTLTLADGTAYALKHLINCQTKGVVYIMFCRGSDFYTGKNKHCFWLRIKDHIYYIKNCILSTPFGKHVGMYHNYNTDVIRFDALDRVFEVLRGGGNTL